MCVRMLLIYKVQFYLPLKQETRSLSLSRCGIKTRPLKLHVWALMFKSTESRHLKRSPHSSLLGQHGEGRRRLPRGESGGPQEGALGPAGGGPVRRVSPGDRLVHRDAA